MVIMMTIKTEMAMRTRAVAAAAATTPIILLEVFSFRLSLDPLS